MPFVFVALMIALFYFFFYRPTMKRQRDQQQLQSGVGVGDRVMLLGGVYATVVGRRGETVELRIADGVVVEAAQAAIARRVDGEAPPDDPPEDGHDKTLTDEDEA